MFIIKIMIIFLNIIYFFLKLFTSTKNKITFISRQSDKPSLDFELLSKAVQNEMDVVVLCRELKRTALGIFSYALHMLQQMYHISTSRIVILDSYCIAVSVLKHKKSLTVIQIWHSMGTMKKFGYSAINRTEGADQKLAKAMKMHHNYDYVFISSLAYRQDMANGLNCDHDKFRVYPLPRLDLLNGTQYQEEICEKIHAQYPILKGKKNILYCPTFRKDERELNSALDKLIQAADRTNYNLIVKLHPLSKIKPSQYGVLLPESFSTFDMLFVADFVISDYSCVVYEAAVRNIPVHFYSFDLDRYVRNRGLAIDYQRECPGVISENATEIIDAIESGEYDEESLKKFTQKYIHMTPHATEDIVDFLKKLSI